MSTETENVFAIGGLIAVLAALVFAVVAVGESMKAHQRAERLCEDAGFHGGYMADDGPRCRNEYPLPESE